MTHLLIDILVLKPGRTVDEAIAYFDGLEPVFERHGISRSGSPLKVAKVLRGDQAGDLVNLFETADPQASLGGMSQDPEYQAQVPTRDSIFDLARSSVLVTAT